MNAIIIRRLICNNTVFNIRKCSTNASYHHKVDNVPLSGLTLGQLFDKCVRSHGNKEAIVSIHENKRIIYEEAKYYIDKVATGLDSLGLEKGDRIGIWMTNRTEWYYLYNAAAKLGLVLVCLNPVYHDLEIEYCLKKVGIKALFIDKNVRNQNHYEIMCKLLPELKTNNHTTLKNANFPYLKHVVSVADEKLSGVVKFQDLMNVQENSNLLEERQRIINVDDPFNIQFTSGTTGKPKAATISQHCVVNNSFGITRRLELQRKHHKICVQVPFFHAFGITPTLGGTLHWGSTLVLPSPMYSPKNIIQALASERCTVLYGTPTMYTDLINKQKELNLDICPEIALSGGAPQYKHLLEQMKSVLKLKKILSLYGLTETTAGVFTSSYDDTPEQIFTTVGPVIDHVEVKVVDEKGRTVPFGTPGELCTRGYCNMLEYWNDEEKTKEMISKDRWLKTGDKFILHENGYGSIVGRIKDMIIRGGENVYPKEIEDFLMTHPAINDVQVIGVSDERLGEEVCAYVIATKGAKITIKNIETYCHGKLAYYKIPKYLRVIDQFPKTTSGKIQKYKLKQLFTEDLSK